MRIDLPSCPLKYCRYQNDGDCTDTRRFEDCPTRNMIEIPDNATNGDVIKTLFPTAKVKEIRYFDGTISHYEVNFGEENNKAITTYMPTWWDAPYKKGTSE